ncbi:MAG: non-homologous end joining protein Ku [Solirubrobacteraceae bacterium]
MPSSLWTGSLSFGLVNVPVSLVTAVRDVDLHFRQLHEKDAAPIDVRRWCSKEDAEVPFEEIAHGYELDDGREVIVFDEELEAIEPRVTRTIAIEQFVDLAEVDPIYFDHPYFLVPAAPDDGSKRAYSLLVEVMSSRERAALGRFVMRAKEYLAIIRVRDGVLTLTTMLFADEVRPTGDIGAATQTSHQPSPRELDVAAAVIEELSTPWTPEKHRDCYRARLQQLVEQKRQGNTVKLPSGHPEPALVPDPTAALERTLQELRQRTRSSS